MTTHVRRSADHLRGLLAANDGALHAFTGDALYHVQVEYTCDLLDIVDEVCDDVTAYMITDAIYGRLSGTGMAEADQRVREARETAARYASLPVLPNGIFKGIR